MVVYDVGEVTAAIDSLAFSKSDKPYHRRVVREAQGRIRIFLRPFRVDHLRTRRTPDPSRIEPGRDPYPSGGAASKLGIEEARRRAMLSSFHQRRHSIS